MFIYKERFVAYSYIHSKAEQSEKVFFFARAGLFTDNKDLRAGQRNSVARRAHTYKKKCNAYG